jgi:hypothetical protein
MEVLIVTACCFFLGFAFGVLEALVMDKVPRKKTHDVTQGRCEEKHKKVGVNDYDNVAFRVL